MVCVSIAVKCRMYQHKVDVDMLNAVKSVLADILSISPSSEQRKIKVKYISGHINNWPINILQYIDTSVSAVILSSYICLLFSLQIYGI